VAGDTPTVRALVMELVPGDTLAERIARGPIAIDEALPIARQIAEALEAAHDAGIIHRDLKPANIKLRPDSTVKVLDFGLAKFSEEARLSGRGGDDLLNSPTFTSPAMTQAGVILGTAAYMSPEQARGREVDKRADIWAFGCVLYEMLTGRAPFPGETVTDVIAAVVKNEPDWSAPGGDAARREAHARTLPAQGSAHAAARHRRRASRDGRSGCDPVRRSADRRASFAGLADSDRSRRAHHRRPYRRSLASTRRLADRDAVDGRTSCGPADGDGPAAFT
jgi:serine/threonine protein kinase